MLQVTVVNIPDEPRFALERRGKDEISRVRTRVLRNVQRATLHGHIRKSVEVGAEMFTDAWVAYTGNNPDYAYNVIDHAENYAEGRVHVNGIENFWSLLKHCLRGTYVAVEPYRLFRYLDEQVYRVNNRKASSALYFIGIGNT
ncbi:MAG TPA: transposase [Candidatus Binataceae bacterium]|nr:transposase [Candidatus Binataceae bacterium]